MARPKSEEKRKAILVAAARVIVAQGLGASTAIIAKEAGVATGTLFTYFETKADLLNGLYLELKTDMAAAALSGFPERAGIRKQAFHIWTNWMKWATSHPEKQRALSRLGASGELTSQTCAEGHRSMARIADLMERIRLTGPLREAPKEFFFALMIALAEATMSYMDRDHAHADRHCKDGFDALWRVMAK